VKRGALALANALAPYEASALDEVLGGSYRRSITVALAIPPPSHMVCKP